MTPGTCVHYTGMRLSSGPGDEPCCKAGVNYREAFDNSRPGIFMRAPCIEFYMSPARPGHPPERREKERRGEVAIPCALRCEPTPEQIAQHRVDMDAALAKAVAGIQVAGKWRVTPKPKKDRHEAVECPVCKGKLHLSQSSFNGHVHGKCETEGCVSWME